MLPLSEAFAYYEYHDHFHGDIYHFREYDLDGWHHGHWFNGWHDGKVGWWWIVWGNWYFYSSPIYPYPDPYRPPVVIIAQNQPMPQYWYCSNPNGYYPYIAQCFSGWQPIYANTSPVVRSQPVFQQPNVIVQADVGTREADDRKLDDFAAELERTKSWEGLRELKEKVEIFRQSLFNRNYNSLDILKDTENLEKRISKKQAKFKHHHDDDDDDF